MDVPSGLAPEAESVSGSLILEINEAQEEVINRLCRTSATYLRMPLDLYQSALPAARMLRDLAEKALLDESIIDNEIELTPTRYVRAMFDPLNKRTVN